MLRRAKTTNIPAPATVAVPLVARRRAMRTPPATAMGRPSRVADAVLAR
jgi:hypothetical protein